ncbi:HlyC/CorC family transporter [bacterium]|nr:HlyC/CorC family transporter [bacterium]
MEHGISLLGEDPLSSTIAFIILILITALMALIEIAYIAARQSILVQLVRKGDWRAKLALPMVKEPTEMLAATQLGITLAAVAGGATVVTTISLAVARAMRSLGTSDTMAITVGVVSATVLFSYFMMVFGELVPKRLAYQFAEPLTLYLAPLLKFLIIITWPFIWLLTASTALVSRLLGIKLTEQGRYTSAELAIILEMTDDFTREEKQLAKRVLTFSQTQVREAMVPRTDFVAISGDKTVDDFIELSLQTGRSRMPVYGETPDDILGVLHLKEAGEHSRGGERHRPLREVVHPALTVPENISAHKALLQMKERQRQMAIVIDEFGQVVGLVTAEDLLEELVGEVFDESDVRRVKVKKLKDGSYLMDAGISLRDLSFSLGSEFPLADDYETLGGLIMDSHGGIPKKGTRVRVNGWEIEVMSMRSQRIRQVRMRKVEDGESGN